MNAHRGELASCAEVGHTRADDHHPAHFLRHLRQTPFW
jgi:hypothetical protein